MNELILGVISSVLASVVIALYATSRHELGERQRRSSYWKSLGKRLMAHGLSNFYTSRHELTQTRQGASFEAYLGHAKKTIKIIGLWMAEAVELERVCEGLGRIVTQEHFSMLEIAIADPKSPLVGPLSRLLGIEEKLLKRRIRDSLDALTRLRGTLPLAMRQRFSLKVYDSLPVASVVMIDDEDLEGRIQFDFKLYKAGRSDSFGFELVNNGGEFFRRCRERCAELLRDAHEFEE